MNLKKTILQIIRGTGAKEEQATLNVWKDEAEENLKALKKMQYIDELSPMLHNYQDVDSQKAWTKIHGQEQITSGRGNTDFRKIAAIFIVVIGAVSLFYLAKTNNSTSENLVYDGNKTQSVQLADGSDITIEKNSILTSKGYRDVTLDGNAYFDIAKNPEKTFSVTIHGGKVIVLGTEFRINTSKERTSISVTEGKVKVIFSSKEFALTAGQFLVLSSNEQAFITEHDITPSHWKSNILVFENKSLKHVMENIAAYYDYRLEWPSTNEPDACKINTRFDDETLEQVMSELEILAGISFEISGKTIVIKSFKC
ncbi:MAG: FecR domain-containing protein [Saprospiraceae bacterium]